MYERKHVPPISRGLFIARMAKHGLVAVAMILVSLLAGVIGFRMTEGYSWLDSYLNAAMLLGGMGQVGVIATSAGKIFAGTYALYAGLVVIAVMGLMMTPVIHRVLHKYHWDVDQER